MSKRQLDNKYEELVKYVNEREREDLLVEILDDATKQAGDCYNPGDGLWGILEKLYETPLTDSKITDLVETIIDVYNGNYELEVEPKYSWKFKEVTGKYGFSFYAFKYNDSEKIGLKEERDLNDDSHTKMGKTELDSLLSETNLTSDNFTPVEEL